MAGLLRCTLHCSASAKAHICSFNIELIKWKAPLEFLIFCVAPLQVQVPSMFAGAIAPYSSWGPNIDLSFKPAVAAPGSYIVRPDLSAYELHISRSTGVSSTSEPCPKNGTLCNV